MAAAGIRVVHESGCLQGFAAVQNRSVVISLIASHRRQAFNRGICVPQHATGAQMSVLMQSLAGCRRSGGAMRIMQRGCAQLPKQPGVGTNLEHVTVVRRQVASTTL